MAVTRHCPCPKAHPAGASHIRGLAGGSDGICINGRFLAGPPSATYATAEHLSRAISRLAATPGFHPTPITLLVPRLVSSGDIGLPMKAVGRLSGNLWEQLDLPRATSGRLLLNFAARSPFLARNALTMVHDMQVFTSPASYSRAFGMTLRANIRMAGRLQRGLLTVSEFAKSEIVAGGIAPAGRVHVIPNGVDHVLGIAPETGLLERLNLVPRRFALALSNLQPHKNIALLLRAFSRPALAGLILVLVGRAGRADFVAAGHKLPGNVVFAGYVSDGGMRALQENALAVLTPSLTEGFGLPPVEGLVLGTPAIIAPCGALPEVCGPGALQADPQDPAAWEAAILRLQNEPDLRQDLAVSGQAFAARYTWEAAAKRLAGVIAGLSAPPREGAAA